MNKSISYSKTKLRKDLEFLLSSVKGSIHRANWITEISEQSLKLYNWLVEDGNTAEEIRNCKVLDKDFDQLLESIEFFIDNLKVTKEVVNKIKERFKILTDKD